MKIRTGFVSNSSTSSFLIVGLKFEEIESKCPDGKSHWDWIRSLNLSASGEYVGANPKVVGVRIASLDSDDFESLVAVDVMKILTAQEVIRIIFPGSNPKLYIGVEGC